MQAHSNRLPSTGRQSGNRVLRQHRQALNIAPRPSLLAAHAAAAERFEAQVAVVLGTQWGDEGKGKLVDILAQQYDIVARSQVGYCDRNCDRMRF